MTGVYLDPSGTTREKGKIMARVKIPATVEGAQDQLATLDGLLRAKEWERAAIVAAFVTPEASGGRPRKVATSSHFLNVSQFAALKISGLSTKDTVRIYVEAWQYAIEQGQAKPVEPGQTVVLPDMKWPVPPKNIREMSPERAEAIKQVAKESGVSANTIAQVMNTPKAVVAAIKADPKIADAIAADPEADRAINLGHSRTTVGKEITRNIKAREAREEEEGPAKVTSLAVMPLFLGPAPELRDFAERVTMNGATDEALPIIRLLGEYLTATGAQLITAAEGVSVKFTDDDLAAWLEGERS